LPAAERTIRQVVELDPSQAESWRNLAVLYREQKRLPEALAACRSGCTFCAYDAGLQMLQGLILFDTGDFQAAELCFLRFLEMSNNQSPASNQPGVRIKEKAQEDWITARHHLASIYWKLRRASDAEGQWRAVIAERPDFILAWLGLAEICLQQRRLLEVEQIAQRLVPSHNGTAHQPEPGETIRNGDQNSAHNGVASGFNPVPMLTPGVLEGRVLRARASMARQDFIPARRILEDLITQVPLALYPHVIYSHCLLQENRDLAAAERALLQILRLEPGNAEAQHNLAILRENREPKAASANP
jgi:tetratricopeptide (TPR) repeat protein